MNTKHTAAQIVLSAIEQTIADMTNDPNVAYTVTHSVLDPTNVRDMVVGGEMVAQACEEIGASKQLRVACACYMIRVLGWSKSDAYTAAQVHA